MTDYLRFVLGDLLDFYKPVIPLIHEALNKTGTSHIIDLCAGSGGCVKQLIRDLHREDPAVHITLTDKFPNHSAFKYLQERSNGCITYIPYSLDATSVPQDLKGLRVLFSSFHHFEPAQAKAILKDAVANEQSIAVFDGGDKNIFTMLLIAFIHPLLFLVCTPFFTPFSLVRLFFTYIISLIPLCTVWDGIASIIRLYKPGEMLAMAHEVDPVNYHWRSGKVKHWLGFSIAYLVGYPNT